MPRMLEVLTLPYFSSYDSAYSETSPRETSAWGVIIFTGDTYTCIPWTNNCEVITLLRDSCKRFPVAEVETDLVSPRLSKGKGARMAEDLACLPMDSMLKRISGSI